MSTRPEPYNNLNKFNDFLESIGITLNDAGGKIKTSEDGFLRQSSTVAEQVKATFPTKKTILRLILQVVMLNLKEISCQRRKKRWFEASNADKIFESTFSEQMDKNIS